MPYSRDINDFYWDFGNGYVPFFAVIGAYNYFIYGDNDVTPATNMVAEAIESFNHMGVAAPIADIQNYFWGFNHIDITDVFVSPTQNPVIVSITSNTNPNVASAILEDNTITIIFGSESGSTEITVSGDDGSDAIVEDVFVVTALDPNLLQYGYDLDDSPEQITYPNNSNPYSNSYIDLGWTSIVVAETDEITNVHFSFIWESLDYALEGSLHAISPLGTDILLYESIGTTPVQLELDTNGFNGESMNGEWIIYLLDSYGDGGHQISDCVVTFQAESSEIGMVTGIVTDEVGIPIHMAVISVSNIETFSDESGQFSFDLLSDNYDFNCKIEGYEVMTINENVATDETTFLEFQLALVAGPNDLTIHYNGSTNEIELNWTYHTPVDQYRIYRSTDPDDFSTADVFITHTENYSETASSTKYFYRVTAENVSDNNFGGNTKTIRK